MPAQSHPARLFLPLIIVVLLFPALAGVAESIYMRNPRLQQTLSDRPAFTSAGVPGIRRARVDAGDYFIRLSAERTFPNPKPAVFW